MGRYGARVRRAVGGVVAAGVTATCLPGAAGAQDVVERALPEDDRLLSPVVTDVYSVGALEGAAWETFGRIRAVAFGPAGDLFVLDQQAAVVHRITPEREYVGTVGGQGSGPGEYDLPTGLAVAPDGRIFVRDTRRGSWAVFGPDGTYLENLRPDGSEGRPSALRFAADGSIVTTPNDLSMVENGRLRRTYLVDGGDGPRHVERLPVLALDAAGGDPRVIGDLWLAPRDVIESGQLRDMAFLADYHVDVLPDGRAAVVDSLTWEVRLLGAHLGVPDHRLTRPVPPQPVTDRLRALEIERRAALPNGGSAGGLVAFGGTPEENRRRVARAAEERLEAGLGFPEVRQVIRDLRVDPQGRIWVARTPEALDPDAPGPVDVLDSAGSYLGTIERFTLPDAFGPDGLAAWIGTGEFDVPVVTVRRIRLP